MNKTIFFFLMLLLYVMSLSAENLKLAAVFSDHMVLQREKCIPLWGEGKPDAEVVIIFNENSYRCQVDSSGQWIVYMSAMEAGGAYEMTVTSEGECIIISDIYVGEVWLASGQSNMDWMMKLGIGADTEKEIQEADYPLIRFYKAPKEPASIPSKDFERRKWSVCTPENAGEFSAVAYFFARELHKELNVPVGILSASWGATSIEAWTNGGILKTHPAYTKWIEDFDTDPVKWKEYVNSSRENDRMRDVIAANAKEGIKINAHTSKYNDKAWKTTNMPLSMESIGLAGYWGFVWLRKSFKLSSQPSQDLLLTGDISAKGVEIWINGKRIEKHAESDTDYLIPASVLKKENTLAIRLLVHWGDATIGQRDMLTLKTLDNITAIKLDNEWKFNSEIEPKLPGWQNYYNTNTTLYNGMIYPLAPYAMRGIMWYQGENNTGHAKRYQKLLPMLINDWRIIFQQGNLPFITVQLPNYMKRQDNPSESEWAEFREAQEMSLSYISTGLVTTIDLGEADDIHPKNKLDVGKRLWYEANRIAYGYENTPQSPVFKEMMEEKGGVRISFHNVESGLMIKGEKPTGFAVAGEDKIFYWADACIENNTVLITSDKVKDIVAVRYGWANNPDANLYNKEGLPLRPFRTDNWEGISKE